MVRELNLPPRPGTVAGTVSAYLETSGGEAMCVHHHFSIPHGATSALVFLMAGAREARSMAWHRGRGARKRQKDSYHLLVDLAAT